MRSKARYRNIRRKSIARARKLFGKPSNKLIRMINRANRIYGEGFAT